MCGICGIVDLEAARVSEEHLITLRDGLAHRGPDDAGAYFDSAVGLGARRLSIIDLSPLGHMPMANEDESVWATYNGEIFNFQTLRAELLERGHRFRSHTDTEVIIHAYEEWGDACVERLSGMFALAIWDIRRRRLFAARDRLGVKPFCYVRHGARLVFASEIHGLYRFLESSAEAIDPLALDYYLAFGYVPSDRGFVKGIEKLPPGHRLVFDASGLRIERWWQVRFRPALRIDAQEAITEIDRRLENAVAMRLVSDVPIGCFLSGGIDSGLVTAIAAQKCEGALNTFSVGFGGASADEDERPLAHLVADRYATNHRELVVDPSQGDLIPLVIRHVGEPFADISALAVFQMSREARRFITVALSGDGGDESFAGYANVRAAWMAERVRARLPEAMIRAGLRITKTHFGHLVPSLQAVGRFAEQYVLRDVVRQYDHVTLWDQRRRASLYTDATAARLGSTNALQIVRDVQARTERLSDPEMHAFTDLHLRLPGDYLTKVDIASNMASLEVRSPFLDYELVEFAATLPFELKLLGGQQKGLLRRLAARHLPPELLRAKKRGFAPRLGPWLRGPWAPLLKETLRGGALSRSGLFRSEMIVRTIDEHLGGTADHGPRLYALLCLEFWWRLFIDGSFDTRGDS